jgi:transketolase
MPHTAGSTQLPWHSQVQSAAAQIRRRVLDHTLAHNGGYMSQACSSAELLATLYLHSLRLAPVAQPLMPRPFPGTPKRGNTAYCTGAEFNGHAQAHHDRFVLSPAHYALVVYTVLIESGRMDPAGLEQFNRDGSSVEMIGAEHSPGCEVTCGSLGQALSQAAGIALARKLRGDTGRVVVMLSDGELQIGQTWEALQAAAHHRLDNLLLCVDVNRQQCDGTVESVMTIEPLEARLQAFGWQALRVDGHDPQAIDAALNAPGAGRPRSVLCDTDPCRGLELLRRNAPRLHYLRFTSAADRQDYARAREAM